MAKYGKWVLMCNYYLVKYYENIVVLVRPQRQIHHFKANFNPKFSPKAKVEHHNNGELSPSPSLPPPPTSLLHSTQWDQSEAA